MSRRSRRARVLAGALTRAAGVDVLARYDRERRGYVIEWRGGPDEEGIRAIAAGVAEDFADLDLSAMDWRRTPAAATRRHA